MVTWNYILIYWKLYLSAWILSEKSAFSPATVVFEKTANRLFNLSSNYPNKWTVPLSKTYFIFREPLRSWEDLTIAELKEVSWRDYPSFNPSLIQSEKDQRTA